MSLSPVNSVATALTLLEQHKLAAAQKAEVTLAASPTGSSTAWAAHPPQDTVSLSPAAQRASGGDVDRDGDSH